MNDKWIKTYFRVLIRKLAKTTAIASAVFAVIFFWYFMKHADDTGLGVYYKVTHFFENALYYSTQYPVLYVSNSISNSISKLQRPKESIFYGVPASSSSIELKWSEAGIFTRGYDLERTIKGENKFKRIARFSKFQTQFEDKALSPRTTYQYRIQSCTFLRCAKSDVIEVKTFNPPPEPVSDLKAMLHPDGRIGLTWQSNGESIKGLEVEMEVGGKLKSIARLDPDQTNFIYCPGIIGATIQFRVKVFNEHYVSENNPVVSVTVPDLERIGETKYLSNISKDSRINSVAWNGKEWAIVFSEETKDQQTDKKNDMEMNTEIYFQRLDEEFKPIGEKTRISFDPCMSEQPSIAWNGKEYAVAWSDSRIAKPYCWEGGDSFVRKEVFFARISAAGRKLGDEVHIPSEQKGVDEQRLFWKNNHYDLFYTGMTDIEYQALDTQGKPLNKPFPVGESSWLWDVTEAGDHYGITWISSNAANHHILYFLDFDPSSRADIKPAKIARVMGREGNQGCLPSGYYIGIPSAFWTGSQFGVCYRDCRKDVALAWISPEQKFDKPVIAMPAGNLRCSDKIGAIPIPFGDNSPPRCMFSGPEIAVLAAQATARGVQFGFTRIASDGVQVTNTKYLDLKIDPYGLSIPMLYGHKSNYFTFFGNSIILLKP